MFEKGREGLRLDLAIRSIKINLQDRETKTEFNKEKNFIK
jgi:hypothetical protein